MSEPMSEPKPATIAEQRDERLKTASPIQRLLSRPELGAVSGLILITAFFLTTANPAMFTAAGIMNFMAPASQLGILAVAAASHHTEEVGHVVAEFLLMACAPILGDDAAQVILVLGLARAASGLGGHESHLALGPAARPARLFLRYGGGNGRPFVGLLPA